MIQSLPTACEHCTAKGLELRLVRLPYEPSRWLCEGCEEASKYLVPADKLKIFMDRWARAREARGPLPPMMKAPARAEEEKAMGMITCWNGHDFDTYMGPGVRGIQTFCPQCGAGTKGMEDPSRLALLPIDLQLLVRRTLTKDAEPFSVIENHLPDDVEIVGVSFGEAWVADSCVLKLRSKSFEPVNPGSKMPMLPVPVIHRSDR